MQKLNVSWKASSCWAEAVRSSSSRAASIASAKDALSFATKFFTPRVSVRIRPMPRRRGAPAWNVYRVPQRSQKDSVRISAIGPPCAPRREPPRPARGIESIP